LFRHRNIEFYDASLITGQQLPCFLAETEKMPCNEDVPFTHANTFFVAQAELPRTNLET
jgi:hypothetical protein